MKPICIARQAKTQKPINDLASWIVAPLFIAGFISGKIWPAWSHWLHLGFYTLGSAVALRFILTVVRIPQPPVNYRSLQLSDTALEYVGLAGQPQIAAWNEIESIVFYRDEALFPDITGPYLETMWLIKPREGKTIQLMDEPSNRAHLLAAFRECLPEFDFAEARRGLDCREKGRWTCFSPPSAITPNANS